MKKYLLLLLFFLLLPISTAWNWQTHSKFADSIYYVLDATWTKRLDLDALRNGSLAPDRDFHDTRLHHYPPSYNKTLYWLEQTEKALRKKDYVNASYTFGVATHYVSDSFAAPHNVEREDSRLHQLYENQADTKYIFIPCQDLEDYDLHQQFLTATKSKQTWEPWLETKEEEYPHQAVAESYKALLPLARKVFKSDCPNKTTTVQKGNIIAVLSPLTLALISVVLYGILSLSISLVVRKQ